MSDFVGFRLNATKDADIIKDLKKYKDTTARVKEAYRRAIALEQAIPTPAISEVTSVPKVAPTKPERIVWNFPKEPTVPCSLKANILSNGF
jgi:hypothetical protein